MFFAVPTAIIAPLTLPRGKGAGLIFLLFFLWGIILYCITIALLIKTLQREYRTEKEALKEKKQQFILNQDGKKRLLLINPLKRENRGLTATQHSTFPPLGLGIVAALTPDSYLTFLIDENIESFEFIDADLVALTSFTANAPRAYEIAEIYRSRGIPVVIGGIHASMLPDEAPAYSDVVVIGEAETIWEEVLYDFEKGSMKKRYYGEIPDLRNLPWPHLRNVMFSLWMTIYWGTVRERKSGRSNSSKGWWKRN
jgi:hypothetical protein